MMEKQKMSTMAIDNLNHQVLEDQLFRVITMGDIDYKLIEKLFFNTIRRLTNEKFSFNKDG